MDGGGIINVWRKHQNLLEVYASVWNNPSSEWKPLTIVPQLSVIAVPWDFRSSTKHET